MTNEELLSKPRSEVVPLLTAALVCDTAVQDAASRKTSLIGIFDNINASGFPLIHPSLQLYVKIADAEGIYDAEIRLVNADEGKVLGRATGRFQAPDRLTPVGFSLPFQNLPFPSPGVYEFQIFMNDAFIGAISIRAIKMESGRA